MAYSQSNTITPETSNLSTTVNPPTTPRDNLSGNFTPTASVKKADEADDSDATLPIEGSDGELEDDYSEEVSEDDENNGPTYDRYGRRLDPNRTPRLGGLWDAQDSLHPDHKIWLNTASKADLKKRGYRFEDNSDSDSDSNASSNMTEQKRSASSERRAKEREENPAKVYCMHEGWCDCPMHAGFEKGIRIAHLSEWALAKGFGIKKEVSEERGKPLSREKTEGMAQTGQYEGEEPVTGEKRKPEDGDIVETSKKSMKAETVHEERALDWE